MPDQRLSLIPSLGLSELAGYHQDVLSALRLYFSEISPTFAYRFGLQTVEQASIQLATRIEESDARSSLAVLTSLEAVFRLDFDSRCRKRLKDPLSKHFRTIQKKRGSYIRLDEDILEGWKLWAVGTSSNIGQLRGMFKFRHWLAHGRYWSPKLGRKYDFETVYLIAEAIVTGFPLVI